MSDANFSCVIVDDESNALYLAEAVLRGAGVSVLATAVDATSALSVIEGLAALPDVVVIDYRLPDMDGIDLGRRLLADYAGLALVLHSGYIDTALRSEAMSTGFAAAVSKDDPKELVSATASAAAGR